MLLATALSAISAEAQLLNNALGAAMVDGAVAVVVVAPSALTAVLLAMTLWPTSALERGEAADHAFRNGVEEGDAARAVGIDHAIADRFEGDPQVLLLGGEFGLDLLESGDVGVGADGPQSIALVVPFHGAAARRTPNSVPSEHIRIGALTGCFRSLSDATVFCVGSGSKEANESESSQMHRSAP